jgi:transposase InsO family protein
MELETEWRADRARLWALARARADYTVADLAAAVGRSVSWVKKWRRRLGRATWGDEAALHSRSRAREHPPPAVLPPVVERILAIRDAPPAHLQRTPGPEAILYFLHHDPELRAAGLPLPRSTATVWRLLRRHGRIAPRRPPPREPWELAEPMTSWQLDFKDVSSVRGDRSDPTAKRQHVVESLDCVDCGTSLLVDAVVRDDFTEETALTAVADLLRTHGRPQAITLDRDPRFVGAPGTGDFPSPLVRFLTCLGVAVQVNPPRRPDLNGYVERFHRTFEEECLRVHRPATLEAAREVTAAFREHYNEERPNQARSCRNQPPRVACAPGGGSGWLAAPGGRPPLPAHGQAERERGGGTLPLLRRPALAGPTRARGGRR